MQGLVEPAHIYLHRDPVDFRKSINGLSTWVESEMQLPLFSGALFLFCNKARDRIKILYWDKTGFALWQKRLEKDKFKWPVKQPQRHLILTQTQLDRLLDSFDVIGHQPLHYAAVSL